MEGQNAAAGNQPGRGWCHAARGAIPPRPEKQRRLRWLCRSFDSLPILQERRRHLGRRPGHQGAAEKGRGMDGSTHVW